MWLSKVCLSNASGWPRHSLMQLQEHSVTAHKSHICRLGSDVVVAVRVHINLIGLLLESTSHACSAGGCLLTSTNSCGARVVVQRFLYVSLFLIHVPNLGLISDPLLRDISMELLLIAL